MVVLWGSDDMGSYDDHRGTADPHARRCGAGALRGGTASRGTIAAAITAHSKPAPRHVTARPKPQAAGTKPVAVPTRLYSASGLAVASDGTLYVVDTSRDEVLRQLPDGEFGLMAGNGQHAWGGTRVNPPFHRADKRPVCGFCLNQPSPPRAMPGSKELIRTPSE